MRIEKILSIGTMLLLAGSSCLSGQQAPPLLTIDDAVGLALKGNRQVLSSAFDIDRAKEVTAVIKTNRLPQFQLYVTGGEALRPITFNIPKGALGSFPATGPIPANDASVTTPQQFTGLIFGQVSQPLSQLWKIRLAVLSSQISEQLAQESLRQQRQQAAHSVRDLYYQIAQTQTQIDSAEANVKYLAELQTETDQNVSQQAALKGDSLAVKAKLSQQRYQLLTLRDAVTTQKEGLNRLLGRDLDAEFLIEPQPLPKTDEIDMAVARRLAIEQRPEIREARLQTKKAENEVRRQRAEYIPDVSASFNYVSLPNVSFAPQNIMQAGFLLQWQPYDWGQKRHKTNALRDATKQSELTEQDAEAQVLLDVNSKFRALAQARALLDTVALSQEAEREKLRVVSNRYGQRSALLSDVLQQEGAITQADSDYQKALAGFWRAKADFDQALGRD